MKDNMSVSESVGYILGLLALFVGAVLVNGFALACLWAWFIVPLGVVEIGVVHAVGIAGVFSLVRGYRPQPKSNTPPAAQLVAVMTYPISTLVIGWVIHLFM